ARAITASVAVDTTILTISATDDDPVFARDLANAVANQLSETVGGLSPERPDGTETVRATMLSEAQIPPEPSAPNPARNLALGTVLGLFLGVGVVLLREILDTKVRSEDDVASVTDL